jgi:hypothetical protein
MHLQGALHGVVAPPDEFGVCYTKLYEAAPPNEFSVCYVKCVQTHFGMKIDRAPNGRIPADGATQRVPGRLREENL